MGNFTRRDWFESIYSIVAALLFCLSTPEMYRIATTRHDDPWPIVAMIVLIIGVLTLLTVLITGIIKRQSDTFKQIKSAGDGYTDRIRSATSTPLSC